MGCKGTFVLTLLSLLCRCSGERVATGSYDVSSNCPGFQSSGSIEIKQKTFYSTAAYDYEAAGALSFGFPSETLRRDGNDLSSRSESSVCAATVAGEKLKEAAFICRNAVSQQATCAIVIRSR